MVNYRTLVSSSLVLSSDLILVRYRTDDITWHELIMLPHRVQVVESNHLSTVGRYPGSFFDKIGNVLCPDDQLLFAKTYLLEELAQAQARGEVNDANAGQLRAETEAASTKEKVDEVACKFMPPSWCNPNTGNLK